MAATRYECRDDCCGFGCIATALKDEERLVRERAFPILNPIAGFPRVVPWWFVAPHEAQANRNHSQTLETLASRGGLDWVELYYVVTDQAFPWEIEMDVAPFARKVLGLILSADQKTS